MYSFKNDYSEGAHPSILKSLMKNNLDQQNGYGDDDYSLKAKECLKEKMGNPDAAVYFVSGGTQANLLVISALLRTHEAVISAATGHIFANETGAVELTGHKVIAVEGQNGKITASDIQNAVDSHQLRPHAVKPKMVYISNSTEIGTVYNKTELWEIAAACRALDLILFMDGARLGHALTAESNDLTLADISHLTDVFYIGGTKNGALFGEAIVFKNSSLCSEFDYVLKQRGALLAKGRVLGIQFYELFREDLYFTLAAKANGYAQQIAEAISKAGYEFLTQPATNQLFPILPKKVIARLHEKFAFYVWKEIDKRSAAVRIITSWATDQKWVDEFAEDIKNSTNPKLDRISGKGK
ncbi:aminotransferase class I/II-fold pyridoxal phosphate-dependent enzyme [Flavobacterium sp. SH_e]|uniref:threonine aldolase family protein n=1 Tax=Flavobacterium TaxID=237 RepID=UPI0021E40610|nr:aminotransferase class I/II-fold pyridoxal phosphate-dependent enzyme [Flavobacterium sp. SH_e]MCV2484799.1 aminotransferase class I/II-fold pyridoxal phosphate-dependent enzyme [Flavobacterium sp. SH_e]